MCSNVEDVYSLKVAVVISFGYVHNYIQDVLFNDISLQRVRMRQNDTYEVAQRYPTFIIPYHEVY